MNVAGLVRLVRKMSLLHSVVFNMGGKKFAYPICLSVRTLAFAKKKKKKRKNTATIIPVVVTHIPS